MSVLIDTSVWIDHFRRANCALVHLVNLDQGLTHPLILLELASSTLPEPRVRTLNYIGLLRPVQQASWSDVRRFIEAERLHGQGWGSVDLALLASTLITPGARLWTYDRPLAALARRFGVAWHASVINR
jgi:predicted nucleic acid-binding protein